MSIGCNGRGTVGGLYGALIRLLEPRQTLDLDLTRIRNEFRNLLLPVVLSPDV